MGSEGFRVRPRQRARARHIPILEDFRRPLLKVDQRLNLDLSFSNFKWAVYTMFLELELYDHLSQEPKSAEEIARDLGLNPAGLRMLLDALAGLGVVAKSNGRYLATPLSEMMKLIGRTVTIIRRHPFWGRFLRLLEGEELGPLKPFHEWGSLEEQMGYAVVALCGEFQRTLAFLEQEGVLEGAKRLIDIGGGHGLYSIGFCKLYPGLEATVFDLPQTLEVTKLFVKAYGMEDRVKPLPGDISSDEIPRGFDVAFMSNVMPEKPRAIVGKVHRALAEGGYFVLKDLVPISDWAEAPYALGHVMMHCIEEGVIWPSLPPTMKEYVAMMLSEGFREAKVLGWITEGWCSIALGRK